MRWNRRYTIAADESRPYLEGVAMRSGQSMEGTRALVLEASDGHRLAQRALPLPAGVEDLPTHIIPDTAVANLIRLAESVDAAALVDIRLNHWMLHAAIGSRTYLTKLIDGSFPNLDALFRDAVVATIVADREEVIAAVHRCLAATKDSKYGVKFAAVDGELTRPAAPKAAQRSPRTAALPATASSVVAADAVLALETHHCRWPVGETSAPDFRFCRATKQAGSSYCARHAAKSAGLGSPEIAPGRRSHDHRRPPRPHHRPYYYMTEAGIEAIDVIERYDVGLHLGTATAYLMRADRKGARSEDFRKARWWLDHWLVALTEGATHIPRIDFDRSVEWASVSRITDAFGLLGDHRAATDNVLAIALLCRQQAKLRAVARAISHLDAAIAEATSGEG